MYIPTAVGISGIYLYIPTIELFLRAFVPSMGLLYCDDSEMEDLQKPKVHVHKILHVGEESVGNNVLITNETVGS